MRKITILIALIVALSMQVSAALKVSTSVNGEALDKTTERLTFSGETVTLYFSDGTSATYDNEAVKLTVEYGGDSHVVDCIIEQAIENCKVFDLNGRFLGTSTEQLPEGVYIVNGKKVYVK